MADHCYRHPDRETRVSCSRCGRPICTDCMTSTSVGMRCPECAGQTTRVHRGTGGIGSGAMQVTLGLIALNVVVFLAELGVGGGGAGSLEGGGTLIRDGGLCGPAIGEGGICGTAIVPEGGEWYRIITSGFLHAGPLHLLLNMFVLYILGQLIEPAVGTARMIGIYFASLLGGSFGALLLTADTLTVGASGAVYGLFGAAIVIARHRGVQDVVSQLGFWLVLNLAFTFSVPGISVGGHLGGLAAGALAAFAVNTIGSGRRVPNAAELATLAGIAVVAAAGALIAAYNAGTGLG